MRRWSKNSVQRKKRVWRAEFSKIPIGIWRVWGGRSSEEQWKSHYKGKRRMKEQSKDFACLALDSVIPSAQRTHTVIVGNNTAMQTVASSLYGWFPASLTQRVQFRHLPQMRLVNTCGLREATERTGNYVSSFDLGMSITITEVHNSKRSC